MFVDLGKLAEDVRRKRGTQTVREVGSMIGISAATLSRVEQGNMPDVDTFARLCRWMGAEPARYFSGSGEQKSSTSANRTISHTDFQDLAADSLSEAIVLLSRRELLEDEVLM